MWVYFNVDFRVPPTQRDRHRQRGAPARAHRRTWPKIRSHMRSASTSRSPGRDSFAYYAVRYWLTDLAFDDPTNSAVRARIYAALKRANIPLAMPTTTTFYAAGGDEEQTRKLARHHDRRRDALRSVTLFAPLTDAEIESLVDHLRYVAVHEGRDRDEARQRRALALHPHHGQGRSARARTKAARRTWRASKRPDSSARWGSSPASRAKRTSSR